MMSLLLRVISQSCYVYFRVMHGCFLPHGAQYDLPMWPSGESTRAPCAVERDALSDRGSNLSRVRPPTKKNYFK